MTEREKIINIIEQNKYCDVDTIPNCRKCKYSKELENYKDMGCSSLKTADALIAAEFGDVTEWKERAEKAEERLKKLKKTEGDLTVEEEINILKNLVEEAKHRSFVFEKELVKYKMAFDNTIKAFHETLSVLFPDTKINLDEWKKDNLANAEKELAEEGKK